MHHSLSIATRGHVPRSTLKALQLATDGFLYTAPSLAVTPTPTAQPGGGMITYWEPYPEKKKVFKRDNDLMELAKMIVMSGILDD
ncbi:MAG: hypothetical protein SWO11_21840 [Thermodesulfobacteriota bacterium]|nr:hypothetical protein [Thermodesulfobacteriota bacterium]